MAHTVVGLFDDRDDAQRAVQNLVDAGISRGDISVVAADADGKFQNQPVDEHGSLAGEGAVSGLTSGAVVGGAIGLLIGAGALAFPAIGLVAIGPLAGALTGAGIGAVSGGIIGALIGAGIPEDDAHVYAEGVRRGGTLVSVTVQDGSDTQRIERILDDAGAIDVDERGQVYRNEGFSRYDVNSPVYSGDQIHAERSRYARPTTTVATEHNYNDVPKGDTNVTGSPSQFPSTDLGGSSKRGRTYAYVDNDGRTV